MGPTWFVEPPRALLGSLMGYPPECPGAAAPFDPHLMNRGGPVPSATLPETLALPETVVNCTSLFRGSKGNSKTVLEDA